MLANNLRKSFASAYIVAGKRTPMGGFQSKLSGYKAPELGGFAIDAAM